MATKVIKSKDCGNSPKNASAEEFVIAVVTCNSPKVSKWSHDDIEWQISRDETIQGKNEILKALRLRKNKVPTRLTIQTVVTHGKAGAVNGTAQFKDKEAVAFCYFIEFASASAKAVKKIVYYECP